MISAAMDRKTILMTIVVVKDIKRKKKNAPGSRRRLVMKYSVRFEMVAFRIL